MADLINTVTWSLGRRDMLQRCPRLYYLRYYEHWNGWDPAAPERRRLAYQLSKMTSVPAYTGVAAHDAIARMAANIKSGECSREVDEGAIRRQMDIIFGASERGDWKRSPKQYPPFSEDVYGGGTSHLRQDAKEKAIAAVREWAESSVVDALVDKAHKFRWLFVDGSRLTHMLVDETPVYCVLDLAVASGDRAFVFDWKTGRPSASEEEQMRLYAMFTSDTWDYPADRIVARIVRLGCGYSEQVFKFSSDMLDSMRDEIRTSIEEMRKLHDAGLAGDEKCFPASKVNCEWCDYRLIC